MIHIKKIFFLVILLFCQSSFASDAVTASEAIAQSKKITQPNGLKSANSYEISPSTVREAQTSGTNKKQFIRGSCGNPAGGQTNYCRIADTSWSCQLAGTSEIYRNTKIKIYVQGNYWIVSNYNGGGGWKLLEWMCYK